MLLLVSQSLHLPFYSLSQKNCFTSKYREKWQFFKEIRKEMVNSIDFSIIVRIFYFFCTGRPGVNPTLCAWREDRDTCDRSGPTSHRWQTFSVAPRLSDKHLSPLQELFFQEVWFLDNKVFPVTTHLNVLHFLNFVNLASVVKCKFLFIPECSAILSAPRIFMSWLRAFALFQEVLTPLTLVNS